MKDFTELEVWKFSRILCKDVYLVSQKFPKEELFGLTNQLRRASVSIPSNIAEGIGRQSEKEILHFLFIARGSLFEVETQLYISFDLGYLSSSELDKLLSLIISCKKLLNAFINYYKK